MNEKIDDDLISDARSTNIFESFSRIGLRKIEEESVEYTVVETSLLSGMGRDSDHAKYMRIVAVHEVPQTNSSLEARGHSFEVFSKAVAAKRGGDANVKFAWYGASKEEICEIVTRGFSWRNSNPSSSSGHHQDRYRNCICLSSAKFSIDSAMSAVADENGMGHLLLCRVILGRQELVSPNQSNPSHSDFDSGVDDIVTPRKYYIWTAYVNSHIIPCYVISFRAPYLHRPQELVEATSSQPKVKVSVLVKRLSEHLTQPQMASIYQHCRDFTEKKITNRQLLAKLREIAGNSLFHQVFTVCKKELEGGSSNNNNKEEEKQ